jgi:uncharacterized protein (TIGR00251 family)
MVAGESTPEAWLVLAPDAVVIRIVARPGLARREFLGVNSRGLVVALRSPPAQGRANQELVELLSSRLRVPRSAVSLRRGASSRTKTIRVACHDPQAVAAALTALIPRST